VIELNVKGMTCGHCVGVVTHAVKSVDPSAAVQVDLQSGRVRIEGRSAAGQLIKALDDAGYPASPAQGAASPTPRKGCCCAR
jgi:copper chaperone